MNIHRESALPYESELILYLTADWWGSDARALGVALRQHGKYLLEVCYEDYLPVRWSSLPLRLLRKAIRPLCAANYNKEIQRHLENPAIAFVLVFKGMLLDPKLLAAFRAKGTQVYCFYPDISFLDHGNNIAACLRQYDCIFTTKSFHVNDQLLRRTVPNIKLVSHGYDPEVHRMVVASSLMTRHYSSDVAFVGCWSPKKERLLAVLIAAKPDLKVAIWGPGWSRAAPVVSHHWQGRGAYGDELSIIYRLAKINLGLLSEAGGGTASGDQTTARTWQIPAAGGFLLHERTEEFLKHFCNGVEAAGFASDEELVNNVHFYLKNEDDRTKIAAAGRLRCLKSNYTYNPAAEAICSYHEAERKR